MNNEFDQEVGTVESADVRKYVYHAGQDSYDRTYYKSMSTFGMGFLEDLRKACYIPALFNWHKKNGKKFYEDETINIKPELIYTVADIYDMCDKNLSVAYLVMSLLRGQIPERFIANLVEMGVLSYYPDIYRCPYNYISCCDSESRENLYVPSAYFKIVSNQNPTEALLYGDVIARKADLGNNYYYYSDTEGKWNLCKSGWGFNNHENWYYVGEVHLGAKVHKCRYLEYGGNMIDDAVDRIKQNFHEHFRENNNRVNADHLRESGAKKGYMEFK